MKSLFTTGLACALCCQSMLTAAQPGQFAGSIESAIRGEALKAALESAPSTDADWRALGHRVTAGDLVTITSPAIPESRRIFVMVTDTSITVMDGNAHIPEPARDALQRFLLISPSGLAESGSGISQKFESIELSNGWLSLRGVRVAPLSDVIQTVQAGDVREVHRSALHGPDRYIVQAALIGLAVGAAAGTLMAVAGDCPGGCGASVARTVLVPVGIGASIGAWAWSTHRRSSEDLIFRRP